MIFAFYWRAYCGDNDAHDDETLKQLSEMETKEELNIKITINC